MYVGAVCRTCDAFGVEKLYLTGVTPHPPHKKITRVARSSDKTVPYEYFENPLELILNLKSQGYLIVSIEITDKSIDLRHLPAISQAKIALIIGSENHGVSQEVLDLSDWETHIPMFGQVSSMNLASAFSVVCYEMIRKYFS